MSPAFTEEGTDRPERVSIVPLRWTQWIVHPVFLAAAGLFLIYVCLLKNGTFFHDDTYITLRYARHVLEGCGPVWNSSGPRVEGFTSPLYLLLVTLVGVLHVPLPLAAHTVNVASHIALLVFVGIYLGRRTNRLGASLGILVLAASWMLIVWDLGGLDGVLYSALSTAGVLTGIEYFIASDPMQSRSLLWGSVFLALAALTRPEGILLLAGLWVCAAILPGKPFTGRLRSLGFAVAGTVILLLPMILFRLLYYHQWAPNTFYAKLGGIKKRELIGLGARYFCHFLIAPPYLGIFAACAGFCSIWRRRFTQRDGVLWALMSLNVLFIFVSGGDHMTAFRFCLALVPLLTAAMLLHLYECGLLQGGLPAAGITLVLLLALARQRLEPRINPGAEDAASRVGTIVGRYISQYWPPGSVIALNTAGSTPYYADRMQYIDMLGLNDAAIARRKNIPEIGPWTHLVGHLKGDGASVLARHPDYIILGGAEGTTPEQRAPVYFIGDYEVGISPYFKANYVMCRVRLTGNVIFTYYQRRDENRGCP
jgi:hypothetical protein